MSIVIHDWRKVRKLPPKPKMCLMRGFLPAERNGLYITGITIHQTATDFGPADLAKKEQRAYGIPAHAVAWRHGVGCLTYPLRWQMYHAGALNKSDLGLEIEGLFCGIDGDHSTIWAGRTPESTKTELLMATAKATLRALVEAGRRDGLPLKYLHAHRQSSASRRSDPGGWLWAGLSAYAEKELGLVPQLDLVVGDGQPIPREWDSRATAKY